MKALRKTLAAIAILLTSAPITASANASFDCLKAGTQVEKMICDSSTISRLDVQLASAYKAAKGKVFDKDELRDSQRAWIKQRNACRSKECLQSSYHARLEFLQNDEQLFCDNPQAQQQMNICAGRSAKKAEATMRRVYEYLLQSYQANDAERAKLLEATQDAWNQYRDSQCKLAEYPHRGGSIAPLIGAGCFESLAEQRTKTLSLDVCEAGGLDCLKLRGLLQGYISKPAKQ